MYIEAAKQSVLGVLTQLKDKNNIENDQWINDEEAMRLLHINSKAALQKYPDDGSIRFP